MEALKNIEEPVGVMHIETNPVIAHIISGAVSINTPANLNSRMLGEPGEFHRVVQQLPPDLPKEQTVTPRVRQVV